MSQEQKRATPERRAELLRLARKSRLHWIISGLDREQAKRSIQNPSADLYRKIPAADCLQQILTFLSNLANDGEVINIEALVPPEGLDEDYDENIPIPTSESFSAGSSGSSYLLFIEKLKHPAAIEIVKLLQQFITRVENEMRLEHHPPLMTQQVPLTPAQDIDEKISKDIWAFLKQIHGVMRENLLWRDETSEQWTEAMTSCEKFLFVKLYDTLFGNDAHLLEEDERIQERIESLSFLSPDHLDMKSLQQEWTRRRTHSEELREGGGGGGGGRGETDVTIGSAVKRLRDISQARCPLDKVSAPPG
jgi:hypothetical protein